MENSIMIIDTYLDGGMWVFDDAAVGLKREPFVAGADTLISRIANGSKKVRLIFSDVAFPGYKLSAEMVSTTDEGRGGTYYYSPELQHDLWLCPALLKYFTVAPQAIYLDYKS